MPTLQQRLADIQKMIECPIGDESLARQEILSALRHAIDAAQHQEALLNRWRELCARNCGGADEVVYDLENGTDYSLVTA